MSADRLHMGQTSWTAKFPGGAFATAEKEDGRFSGVVTVPGRLLPQVVGDFATLAECRRACIKAIAERFRALAFEVESSDA